MNCWRFDLRRKMVPYIEGELAAHDVNRIEQHLLDCGMCRELLLRLRAGHQMAQHLPHFTPGAEHEPQLEALLAGAAASASMHHERAPLWEGWLGRLATPRMVTALTVLVLIQATFLLLSNRGFVFGERGGAAIKLSAMDLREFRQLSIPELKSNTQPHVATDGYVTDVHTDEEEGTVAFKLVDGNHAAGSFVVCEIMNPIHMPAPAEGSHVRVYGVARYDAQADRKWYEVNPVLNISVLAR